MKIKEFFTENDLEKIKDAVSEAEKGISGEIVPFFAEESDSYIEAEYKAFIIGLCVPLFMFSILYEWLENAFFYYRHVWVAIISFSFFIGTTFWLLTRYVEAVKRIFAGKKAMAFRVHEAAERVFLEQEVFATQNRTGVLIYLSLMEHRAEILTDKGLSSKISNEEWQKVLNMIIQGIKNNRKTEGLVEGISECGMLLRAAGFTCTDDSNNELDNNLRF